MAAGCSPPAVERDAALGDGGVCAVSISLPFTDECRQVETGVAELPHDTVACGDRTITGPSVLVTAKSSDGWLLEVQRSSPGRVRFALANADDPCGICSDIFDVMATAPTVAVPISPGVTGVRVVLDEASLSMGPWLVRACP